VLPVIRISWNLRAPTGAGSRVTVDPSAFFCECIGAAAVMNPFRSLVNLVMLGRTEMAVTLAAVCALVLLVFLWIKRLKDRQEMEQHSITPELLHTLLASNQGVLLFDVRLPLDLLADSEIIPGARRLSPKEVLENPSLIPKDKDSVVYCTCPSDKTSRTILRRALAMGFLRVKFLKGGLEGWKAMGYPIEPYQESFHLDTGT
jgi:rhodanese-related sulfurtransferase